MPSPVSSPIRCGQRAKLLRRQPRVTQWHRHHGAVRRCPRLAHCWWWHRRQVIVATARAPARARPHQGSHHAEGCPPATPPQRTVGAVGWPTATPCRARTTAGPHGVDRWGALSASQRAPRGTAWEAEKAALASGSRSWLRRSLGCPCDGPRPAARVVAAVPRQCRGRRRGWRGARPWHYLPRRRPVGSQRPLLHGAHHRGPAPETHPAPYPPHRGRRRSRLATATLPLDCGHHGHHGHYGHAAGGCSHPRAYAPCRRPHHAPASAAAAWCCRASRMCPACQSAAPPRPPSGCFDRHRRPPGVARTAACACQLQARGLAANRSGSGALRARCGREWCACVPPVVLTRRQASPPPARTWTWRR